MRSLEAFRTDKRAGVPGGYRGGRFIGSVLSPPAMDHSLASL